MRRFELATDDPEKAVEIVRSTYADTRMRISGDEAGFFYRQRTVSVGPLAMDEMTSPMGVTFECPPLTEIYFAAAHRARCRIHSASHEVDVFDGHTLVHPVDETFTSATRDLDIWLLRLPVALAAARAGLDPQRFRFTSLTPNSPALGRYFRATMQHIHSMLREPDTALAEPLVLAGAIDMIAGTALATFPYTIDPADEPPGRAGPAAVRRAAAFIEANAARPLSLADIATAAGIGVRALQAAFSRHLDTTPRLHLRRVRLAHAHRDLETADPGRGDEVSAIARRWGFGHLGRFASYYRSEYGHSPRYTLNN
ncbi:helix-turn-helix transcriptional regulator [Krasilnikovia cinnamomea]|uniref:helix-turn-helix transcriptional regulator n=1 Tax=Krasilnikovia cinnamomea TaxID=349313 RepID=UPI00102BCD06|nr:helix-turn-helix transcriptional regulator [Krasilnikovia cinnamomea]